MSVAADIHDIQLSHRVTWLCRLLGVGGLALLAVTWKLWTPQDVFPRVPLFAWAPPRWWDWASLAGLTAGLVGLCFTHQRWRRVSATMVACGFAVQFLADQHRLQPWAWQFFILAVVIALADDRLVFWGWMALVISIYFWSALSKFDVAFGNQVGDVLYQSLIISSVTSRLGPSFSANDLHDCLRFAALLSGPYELLLALALAIRLSRVWGFWGSLLLHLGIISLLGPWGLGHQPGVLLWNALFIVQNTLLFRQAEFTNVIVVPPGVSWFAWLRLRVVWCLLAAAMIWPVVEPWGYCDAWLGWAVYVPRFQRAFISVNRREAAECDCAFRDFVSESSWLEDVDVGRMSLKLLGVPSYPNHRFTVAIALDFLHQHHQAGIAVWLGERHDRWSDVWWWKDDHSEFGSILETPAEIEAYACTFRVNALPESALRRRAEKP
jgi:hypothetical protein